MQTFLPISNLKDSVECLDNKRLNKQRVEVYQILLRQFSNHPASKMWSGHEDALAYYGKLCVEECIKRGFNDHANLLDYFDGFSNNIVLPSWFGSEAFHASHRSNLLRKDYTFYSQYGWTELINLPYVWPK